ncbi:MAG: Glu-tRNA(Gln) amidotransferase subunit GatE [Candidatus Nanoarchaeia archaeon]|nr:Glu-tRNA(Gln) amidotransferase subunit GatE [Candidatus Nanoarchaeia archaeon]MDD5239544.1 Glu-tRNA(Gln) amidotransferase subunit GatE [Candidatus Nanoarchaeia archaeon]
MSEYEKVGLKVGLEVHQQLDSHKLFCNCPSVMRDKEPDFTVIRKQKAVAGEMGLKDIAAEAEEFKDKTFVYEGYNDTTCLVELDEEPVHPINKEALEIALIIAKSLNMRIFDEIEVMRKTVINGSNTSGFQRTALVGENGFIETSRGKVRVNMLAIEEDAAREMRREEGVVNFRLDRLGIPLVELRTEPDITSPEQAKETAEKLGLLMRMTGRVKRGIGTIRQDVNVSIKGGSRIEIKGFQELNDIPAVIKGEIDRQKNVLEIRNKLNSRKAKAVRDFKEVSRILSESESKLVKEALERGEKIIGMKLKGFDGMFKRVICGERTYAKEFVDYLKHFTDMKGFMHTDELPKYGIIDKQVFELKQLFTAGNEDLVLFLFGSEKECHRALHVLADRAEQLIAGVPSEVRNSMEDMSTKFLRPMPGASRMYPETDELPVKITKEMLKQIKLPDTPDQKMKKYVKLGLGEELSKQMIHSEYFPVFEELTDRFRKLNPILIASNLLSARDEIRKRFDANTDSLNKKHFIGTFELLENGNIAKEAVIELLAWLAVNPQAGAEEAMRKLKLQRISKKELEKFTDKILEENKELVEKKQFGVLMGFLMRKVRGRIDGELVSEVLKKKMGL